MECKSTRTVSSTHLGAAAADASTKLNNKQIKAASTSAVVVVDDSITVATPAPINRLPYELRQLVISCVDDDAFTLLNLLLVSKVWYLTLTDGKQAEHDWARRCETMGVNIKAEKCSTWHATFIDLLHRRCIRCYSKAIRKVGPLLPYGFTFIKVCRLCPWLATTGPLKLVETNLIHVNKPQLTYQLSRIPMFHLEARGLSRVKKWTRSLGRVVYALQAALEQAETLLTKEMETSQALLDAIKHPDQAELLKAAFTYVRERKQPDCKVLEDCVRSLQTTETPDMRMCSTVIGCYETLQTIITARDAYFEEQGFKVKKTAPFLEDFYDEGDAGERTWLDALICGEVNIDAYLKEVTTLQGIMSRLTCREKSLKKAAKRDVSDLIINKTA